MAHRAELHDDADSVTVAGTEYASIVCSLTTFQHCFHRANGFQQHALQEFQALKAALLAGGVAPDAIETLISSVLYPPTALDDDTNSAEDSPEKARWSADAAVFVPKKDFFSKSNTNGAVIKPWRDTTNIPPTPPSNSQEQSGTEKDDEETGYYEEEEEQQYENNHDDRSLVLRGLSPFTTLVDIENVLRGGIVLNMFIRSRDRERSAHVAFVEPLVAEKFIMHCKRNDLYIKGRRIKVYWDEKQHYMPGHIARRVYNNNATRNLVIRFPNSDTTLESICDDLEHIHNLEVVSCEMKNGHAFFSTNGIGHAVTARTCMQSRLKYKSTRIEFYPDECDQPLPEIVRKPYKRDMSPNKTKYNTISHVNRFALLVDGEEDDFAFEEAHQAAARRNVSAGDAVWETKIATVPVL